MVLTSVGYGEANNITTRGGGGDFRVLCVHPIFSHNFSQFTPIPGAEKKKCQNISYSNLPYIKPIGFSQKR